MKSAASRLAVAWLACHLGAGGLLGPGAAGLLGAGAAGLLGPRTASPLAASLGRLEHAARRPLPPLPAAPARSAAEVWVPDRWVPAPHGLAHVPGHRERPTERGEVFVPPLVSCTATGHCAFHPAGRRPPAERRLEP